MARCEAITFTSQAASPVLVRHVLEIAPPCRPCVVDQHVRLAQRLARRAQHALARRRRRSRRRPGAAARPPAARQTVTASSRRSADRATSSTDAPSAHSCRPVSSPMPRLAPVTTHTFPARPRSTPRSLKRATQAAVHDGSAGQENRAGPRLDANVPPLLQAKPFREVPAFSEPLNSLRAGLDGRSRGEAGEPTLTTGVSRASLGLIAARVARRSAISFGASPTANPVSVETRTWPIAALRALAGAQPT